MGSTRLQPGSCCGCAPPGQSCGSCTLPTTLHLTDQAGTCTLTYDAGTQTWTGCQTLSVASAVNECDCFNTIPPSGGAAILIQYKLITSSPNCVLERTWPACNEGGSNNCFYCAPAYSGCNEPGSTCSGQTGITCGASGLDQGNTPSCTLPISMTLTLGTYSTLFCTLNSPFSGGSVTIQS